MNYLKDLGLTDDDITIINGSSEASVIEKLKLFPSLVKENYTYLKDGLVVTPIEFEVRQNGIIGTIGVHSYSNKLKWEMDNGSIYVYKKRIFSNFKGYIIAIGSSNTRIARFHIPKGYQYAENKDGEIISSAIVFDGFID